MSTYQKFSTLAGSGNSPERTSFFSDAVFAIAMTLLAVEIHVPAGAEGHLGEALAGQVPEFLSYMLSFAVIGVYWMAHHRYFKLLVRYNQNLQRLNLLMLMLLALVPFATHVLGTYGGDPAAVVVYAALIAGVGGVQVWLWEYAWHRGLFTGELGGDVLAYMRTKSLIVPAVFLLSIPVALLWGAASAEYLWACVLVGNLALLLSTRRDADIPAAA